jgi:hypothetical protein
VKLYLGIDPGVTGALAVLQVDDDGQQTVTVTPTPVLWVRVGRGKRRRYEIGPLLDTLRNLPPIALACLEEQHARPGQGVASTFATGYGAGMWTACLIACRIPFLAVHPRRWRQLVGLPHAGDYRARKAQVRLAACRRFPRTPLKLEHADAVMLAVAATLEHRLANPPPCQTPTSVA